MAYRDIEMLPSPAPEGTGLDCLLLVHIRKVVGRVTYQACGQCAEGVITNVVLDEPFRDCGLGTRALSHLRSQYPGVAWRSTFDRRLTRDLLRRMRVPKASAGGNCPHGLLAALATHTRG
ncbi:N-acetyltransferase [Streptomyces sp. NBC_00467]|uniref:N-acetyltransferase n=1 Tax=Streptomyces sp. NBC_00467 TaxID=2975752 RepID=UPI002E18CD23